MTAEKNISFLVPGLGSMGGSVRVATQIANRLVETHNVSMISCAPFEQVAFPVDERIETFSLNITGGRLRERVSLARDPLTRILKSLNAEVLFGIGTYETLMSVLPCRKTKTTLVFCDHGALANQWNDKQMRVISLLDALFSKKTVVLTDRSHADYQRLLRIPARKLRRIHNWIPAELVANAGEYQADSKKLLWAGRLDKEKGVDHLLDIAARVLPSHPDWVWDVYGEEVMSADGFDARKAAFVAGISDQLRFMGKVDNLYSLYREYGICTLTSYREGLPLVLLEARANKLPLISFDVITGPADIIDDEIDGFLVPCYDCEEYARKLSLLMSDVNLRMRMSQAGEESLQLFSEEHILKQWLSLLAELGA